MTLSPLHKIFPAALLAALFLFGAVFGVSSAPQKDAVFTDELKKKFEGVRTDLPGPLQKGTIRIITSVDKKVIRVGDIIHYELIVEAPKNSKVALPPPGSQLGRFMIRDYHLPLDEEGPEAGKSLWKKVKELSGFHGKEKPETRQRKFSFDITCYETGEYLIPPVPVVIMDPSGDVHGLLAESVLIEVAPVTGPDELSIKDIESPVTIPMPWGDYWYLFIVPAVIIVALPIGYYLYRRYSSEGPVKVDLRPAHVIVGEDLDKLREEGLLEAGEYEKFYTRLSWILRKYLSLRYSMYALEYTTREIVSKLDGMDPDFSVFEKIKGFLEEADRVKFARHTPGIDRRNSAFGRVEEIIETTREREEEERAA